MRWVPVRWWVLMVLAALFCDPAPVPANQWPATDVDCAGVECLDSIDGASLSANDMGFLFQANGSACLYTVDLSGDAESLESPCPTVVAPNTNPGSLRWKLLGYAGYRVIVPDGTTYTNFGGASDDTLDEILSAIDTAWPTDYPQDDAPFVTVTLDPDLDAERRLQVGNGLSLTDAGANGDLTVSLVLDGGTLSVGVGGLKVTDSTFQPLAANLTSLAAAAGWRLFYSDGSGALSELTLGTVGQVLTSQGASVPPQFADPEGQPGGANTEVQFNDAGELGGDAGMTYDKAADQLTVGTVRTARASTPRIPFGDSDCADSDDNAVIEINATDTGSGTEDVDLDIRVQIDGVETDVVQVDADGDLSLGTATMATVALGGLQDATISSAGFAKTDASGNFSGGYSVDVSDDTNLSTDGEGLELTGDQLALELVAAGDLEKGASGLDVNYASFPRLVAQVDTAAKSATNETADGTSVSVPDGTLAGGMSLRFDASGTATGTNDTKDFHLYIDNAQVCTLSTQDNADVGDFTLSFEIYQATASSQEIVGALSMTGELPVIDHCTDTTNFSSGSPITVKLQYTSADASDTVTQELCRVTRFSGLF